LSPIVERSVKSGAMSPTLSSGIESSAVILADS
jgi:hypothetical protein